VYVATEMCGIGLPVKLCSFETAERMKRLNSIVEDEDWASNPSSNLNYSSLGSQSSSSFGNLERNATSKRSSSSLSLPSLPPPSSNSSISSRNSSRSVSSFIDSILSRNTTCSLNSKCNIIMNCIVREAYHFPSQDWKEQFASIDWSKVENSHHSDLISLPAILLSTFNFILTHHDKEILLTNYTSPSSSTSSSSFQWQKFLLDFFIKFASLELEEEDLNLSATEQDSSSSKGNKNISLWYRVQKKLSTIQAMNAFKATGSEISRHRALSLLLEAIGRLHHSRFGSCCTQSLNFAASVNRNDFRKYLTLPSLPPSLPPSPNDVAKGNPSCVWCEIKSIRI
jgi:hypothetical protein